MAQTVNGSPSRRRVDRSGDQIVSDSWNFQGKTIRSIVTAATGHTAMRSLERRPATSAMRGGVEFKYQRARFNLYAVSAQIDRTLPITPRSEFHVRVSRALRLYSRSGPWPSVRPVPAVGGSARNRDALVQPVLTASGMRVLGVSERRPSSPLPGGTAASGAPRPVATTTR